MIFLKQEQVHNDTSEGVAVSCPPEGQIIRTNEVQLSGGSTFSIETWHKMRRAEFEFPGTTLLLSVAEIKSCG